MPRHMRRTAFLLIAVLAAIAIASLVMVSLAKLLGAERRAVEADQWHVQAAWLAESGLERAASRLRADPKYAGENWKLPADAFPGGTGGAVRIEIQPIPEQPLRRKVRVQADYPDDVQDRARESREAVVALRAPRS